MRASVLFALRLQSAARALVRRIVLWLAWKVVGAQAKTWALCCAAACTLSALSAAAELEDAGVSADATLAEDAEAAPPDSAAPERTAPRALFVPALAWPADQPPPGAGSIDALVVIERDGVGQLERCEHAPSVCEALSAALARAKFAPATVHGEPSAARVQVRFALVRDKPANDDAGVEAPDAATAAALSSVDAAVRVDASASGEPSAEPLAYGAVARIEREKPLATALELEEIRELPGALGDPFRVIDSLPGVVPVMSGLPYVYVRGAPPAATVYYYDDIQLPALFHLALGPAVVHPAMVGGIDFYPGVAPARYGRKTGGVVAGKAMLRELKPGVHGELELRLIDLQAYLATPVRKTGRFEIAARYGYPGLLTKLFDARSVVQYWDYQLRSVVPLSRTSEATVIAIGSFDLIGQREHGKFERSIELQFHRVEARLVQRGPGFSLGSALSAGFERSGLGDDINVRALRVGPKLWFDLSFRRASLRLGADMLASVGKIYQGTNSKGNADDEKRGPFSFSDNPIYRSAAGRNVIGAYAELNLPIVDALSLEAGLRGDTWLTGGQAQGALEPRALLRYQAKDWLSLHAAFGTAYQPAVFLIPLPGISDVALDRGLQRAIQAEVGARFSLPYAFSVENKLFAHFYKNMLAIESVDLTDVECENAPDPTPMPAPGMATGQPDMDPSGGMLTPDQLAMQPVQGTRCMEKPNFARISARAYGSEWLIRRASSERISGWLSYTLAKASARAENGKVLTPNFDVRHVANLVAQWRISQGWHVALRGMVQSGRFPIGTNLVDDPRNRARLPPFVRGDLQVSRTWQKRWGELRLTLDWLNFTLQREPLSWNCNGRAPGQKCKVENAGFPITIPLLGLRATY